MVEKLPQKQVTCFNLETDQTTNSIISKLNEVIDQINKIEKAIGFLSLSMPTEGGVLRATKLREILK